MKFWKPSDMILTAGPKRSKNEVAYVTDAVKNGWNRHHSDYIYAFEKAFAKYVGVKYALTMPTGTSAMHLALTLFGVGPGDEVIVPDFTYIACANVVHYTGATPVFVDVDPVTWSIDVTKIERFITKKTKAIMPVHLYGNAADMPAIMAIARKHKLLVLEDACEGLGGTLGGKQLGSFGDAAAFSFQGAKLVATGEGGMFTTNKKEYIDQARSLVDHGISFTRQFWHTKVGFMYPMSNIQAALGLARLEEIGELVKRKRQIFSWYKKRLSGLDGILLNPERPGLKSSFWMSSIVLDTPQKLTRDKLREALKKELIDTRPFFYPQTAFGLYGKKKANTPVSYHLSGNGINLPSGVMRTEQEIDYISRVVVRLLTQKKRLS